jgi:hypothetical protein
MIGHLLTKLSTYWAPQKAASKIWGSGTGNISLGQYESDKKALWLVPGWKKIIFRYAMLISRTSDRKKEKW